MLGSLALLAYFISGIFLGQAENRVAPLGCLRYSAREPAARRRFPLAAPLTASAAETRGTSSAGAQGAGAQGRAGQAVRVADAASGLELPESRTSQVG